LLFLFVGITLFWTASKDAVQAAKGAEQLMDAQQLTIQLSEHNRMVYRLSLRFLC
jgi:hypothetical protein